MNGTEVMMAEAEGRALAKHVTVLERMVVLGGHVTKLERLLDEVCGSPPHPEKEIAEKADPTSCLSGLLVELPDLLDALGNRLASVHDGLHKSLF